MDDRLTNLEVRYTHLERKVDDLSQVVFEQQRLIDRLTKELTFVRDRVAGVEDGPPDERPPHY